MNIQTSKSFLVFGIIVLFASTLCSQDGFPNRVSNQKYTKDEVVNLGKPVRPFIINESRKLIADTLDNGTAGMVNFTFHPGDVLMEVYKAPTELRMYGVGLDIFTWNSDGTTPSLKVEVWRPGTGGYPYLSEGDGTTYPNTILDSDGWIGYAHATDNDTTPYPDISSAPGLVWNGFANGGPCNNDPEPANGQPLYGTKVLPTGLDDYKITKPHDGSTGYYWVDFTDEDGAVFVTDEYIAVVVTYLEEGAGDPRDSNSNIGFFGGDASEIYPYPATKFYNKICDGVSGNQGWHIRHYNWRFAYAVEYVGSEFAGPDQEVEYGDLVTLDGTQIMNYEYLWTQISGTNVTLSSHTDSIVTFTAPNAFDLLSFELTITDTTTNISKSDTVNINVLAPYQLLVINEIMNNPLAVPDADGEWFELYNSNSFPVYLNGWDIRDNDNDSIHIFVQDSNVIIQPSDYFILGSNEDSSANGGIHIDFVYSRESFNLGNSTDEIILYNPNGQEIDKVEYDDGLLFPDPNGNSMELIYFDYDNSLGSNWSISTNLLPSGDYSTPRETNSVSNPELYLEFFQNNDDYLYLGAFTLIDSFMIDSVFTYELDILNSGTDNLNISSIGTKIGKDVTSIYTEYGIDSIIVISPFQQEYIEIKFNPQNSSIYQDTLVFNTNDTNFVTVQIPIEAWATSDEREIHIEPPFNEIQFDSIEINQIRENNFKIYNLGYTTLEIDEISTTTPFSVVPRDGSIDTLGFLNVVVSFIPDSVGDYERELIIESNDSDEGSISLTLVGYSYILGVDDGNNQLPLSYALHQNYPNPFNPITTLRYDLPENSLVNIVIYNMLGREVKTLINQTQDAGFKSIQWNATNDNGKPVSAGVYLYQIHAGDFVQTKKIVLLK